MLPVIMDIRVNLILCKLAVNDRTVICTLRKYVNQSRQLDYPDFTDAQKDAVCSHLESALYFAEVWDVPCAEMELMKCRIAMV